MTRSHLHQLPDGARAVGGIISLSASPLRPFRVDIRDKAAVRGLLYLLGVRLIGWNVAPLCDAYFFTLAKRASRETHRAGLVILVAIFVSEAGDRFLEDASATFDPRSIDRDKFFTFVEKFVEAMKLVLARDSGPRNIKQPIAMPSRRLFRTMDGYLYRQGLPRNPTIPVVTAFMLILLADLFLTTIQTEPGAAIASSLWARVVLFDS